MSQFSTCDEIPFAGPYQLGNRASRHGQIRWFERQAWCFIQHNKQCHQAAEARLRTDSGHARDKETAGSPLCGGKTAQRSWWRNNRQYPNPPSLMEGRKEEQLGAARVPKYSRLEFPTYDGSEDLLMWVHCCKQFFHSRRIREED